MTRALSLYLPMWSIDLVRRRHHQKAAPGKSVATRVLRNGRRDAFRPNGRGVAGSGHDSGKAPAILLVRTVAGAQRIARRCEIAAAAGVQPSMTVAHAHALLTDVEVHTESFDEHREARSLRSLAFWAMRFSPVVALDPSDGLLIDITGCERLFHGERRLVNVIANTVQWLGFRTRIASAETYGCAWATARFGGQERAVIPAGDEREVLMPLPIEALRLDDDVADALHEVGIELVGHLMELPRLELAARFSSDLLLHLDQALGEAIETVEPIRPKELPQVEREFTGPVKQLEAIMITVHELIDRLSEALQRLECGVTRLQLTFERSDAGPVEETIELSRPSRSCEHLWSLLSPKVETVDMGFGVERIVLAAVAIGRLRHRQVSQWRGGVIRDGDDQPLDEASSELVDTLAGRLGEDRAVCISPMQSYIPERAFNYQSAMRQMRRLHRSDDMEATLSERPSVLFDPPESVEVMALTPDGPPEWMRWRGEEYDIVSAIGPERIARQWWDDQGVPAGGIQNGSRADVARNVDQSTRAGSESSSHPPASSSCRASCATSPSTRDYFKIQDDLGRWLWIYRVIETGRWFVHGQWA